MQRMEYDVGDGPQETQVVVFASTLHNHTIRHCKFFNLLHVPLALYWDNTPEHRLVVVKVLRPLSTAGITATVGNVFSLQLQLSNNDTVVLERFHIRPDGSNNVFSIDPKIVPKLNEQYGLPSSTEHESYTWLTKTLTFHEYYYKFTKRSFLSRYGKLPPQHFMWPADFVGQTHSVARHHLTVLSCAPRVLEIRDFLSVPEVQHMLELAQQKEMAKSQTGDAQKNYSASQGTRSSHNTWIWPEESPVIQTIYRRAYELLQIDPTLNVTEPLQLVRYRPSEAYQSHVDFGYPDPSHPQQPTRFATLLLYLNRVHQGGETAFGDLRVRPERGKAVLFYMQTPDGNMDEMSLHAALPVLEGEKWLANLWFWEPVKDVASLQ